MKLGFKRRSGEIFVLAGFLAVGLLVFQQIATNLADQGAASGDPLYNAGLFPRVIGAAMLALAALVAVRTLLGLGSGKIEESDNDPADRPESMGRLRWMQLGMIVLLVVYIALLDTLGFHITTTVCVGAMFLLLQVRPWYVAFATGFALMLVVSFIFEGLLQVVLPTGITGYAPPYDLIGL